MKRFEAATLLYEYSDRPIFSVKIGMCSPQVQDVDLETALNEFDRCERFRRRDVMEYVCIYCSDIVEQALRKQVERALQLFDLGMYQRKEGDGSETRMP